MKALLAHDWPGNVRELENCLERCCAMASGSVINVVDLPSSITGAPAQVMNAATESRIVSMLQVEKQTIMAAITRLNEDKLMAAKLLGIGKTTLYRKLKEYGAAL
jgi:two-component system response regulator HydG